MKEIKNIGIIGFGNFGEFLFTLAKKHFPQLPVRVHSSRKAADGVTFFTLEEVCKSDVLLVCAAISSYKETIEKIVPLLGVDTVVVDVATVKTHTVSALKQKGVPHFIASHPMFGPNSYAKLGNTLKGMRIVVCDSSLSEAVMQKVVAFLRATGLNVLELTADEHDRLVAETLFLTHLVGQTIKKGNFKRTAIDTASFGFLMDAAESVANDEALFRDVFKYNPYCKEVLHRFEQAAESVKSTLNRI